MENDTNNLIIWAAAVAETVEINTGEACSTTHIINQHSKETKKLLEIGISHDDAVKQAMINVENILGGKTNES